MYTPDHTDEVEEEIEYQDVAMAYLTGGMDRVLSLYAKRGIPPEVSQEAWEFLSANGRTEERLAIALLYMHAPVAHENAWIVVNPMGKVLPLGAASLYAQ